MPHFIRYSQAEPDSLRALDVRPDDTDARDYIFEPSLTLLAPRVDHRGMAPMLDQGDEGACVGFALATVINISLNRRDRKRGVPAQGKKLEEVSARMLYEMARRYDEWRGEQYEGTSLRGAMKGWHKHGVTTEDLWKSRPKRKGDTTIDREFTPQRAHDALRRPIGAYFRIVDSDVGHLQAAVAEGDAVLASAWVHSGWQNEQLLDSKGSLNVKRIPPKTGKRGLHAFAIVGYTPEGFLIQNSWGSRWGTKGYTLLAYDDWFENRQDAWVARPGPETKDSKGSPKIFVVGFAGGGDETRAGTAASGLDLDPDVLPHLINTGDRGELSSGGRLSTKPEELRDMARRVLTSQPLRDGFRHVVLYAHGGLNSETDSAATANRLWALCRQQNLQAYFFIWESGLKESVRGWLKSDDDASGPTRFSWRDAWDHIKQGAGNVVRSAQKVLGANLAPMVREVFWDEMKGRAQGASSPKGGAALFADELFTVMARIPDDKYKIHLVGHSAGSIFLGWLYQTILGQRLAQTRNITLGSIQFMAPAITMVRAQEAFCHDGQGPVSKEKFVVYTLKPTDEENDNIQVYPSSLLTYVADHLEDRRARVPLLGIRQDFDAAGIRFATPVQATTSVKHGEFDDKGREVEQIIADIAATKF